MVISPTPGVRVRTGTADCGTLRRRQLIAATGPDCVVYCNRGCDRLPSIVREDRINTLICDEVDAVLNELHRAYRPEHAQHRAQQARRGHGPDGREERLFLCLFHQRGGVGIDVRGVERGAVEHRREFRADERGSRQAESSDSKRKLWNVTMKLDVGDFGELLAKSRIDGDVIELDLYTSTDALLQRVADTLPLLKRRLTALGLEVAQSSFQRGKIPSTLQNRPYHIFETQA